METPQSFWQKKKRPIKEEKTKTKRRKERKKKKTFIQGIGVNCFI